MLEKHRAFKLAALAIGAYWGYRWLEAHRRQYDFSGKCVLITGGSRGLGLVMARQLVAEGARVAICSRHGDEVTRAVNELQGSGGVALGVECDATEPREFDPFVALVEQELGPIDVLINNAGVIQVGPADEMTTEDYKRAMDVHFAAPLHAMQRIAPAMRRRRTGRIVNIASIGGQFSAPHLLPYCASKFALVGLSQGMRAELACDGVYVTTVCPGLMRTGSHRHALFKGQHRREYVWFSFSASAPLLAMSAERAARHILNAARYGRAQITLSIPAKVAATVNVLAPELVADLASLAIQLLPEPGGISQQAVEGEQSTSAWSPSFATLLGERAAIRNNEISPHSI
jgi:NAD(P)-dependent dehydrogenase (short-subunit alcohol dehydrogenase family)